MRVPLSAMLSYSRVAPVILILSLGKTTFTVALPALTYWQVRHQHVRTVTGSASTS